MGDERVAVVIEDEPDIRHLLETVLTQAGFQVIATSNGHDGVEAVRRYEPLVTTLDVNMPGMDGFEPARRIREFSATYLIMLTALSEEIDTLQGLEAGADDYVNKPFRPRELRARIDAMLRRPRVGQGAATAAAPVSVPAGPPVGFAAAVDLAHAPPLPAPGYAPGAPSAAVPVGFAPVAAPPATPVAPATVPPEPIASAPAAAGTRTATERPEADAPESVPEGEGWLTHNGLWVNIESRLVQREGQRVDLTRSEFDLLVALLTSGRRVRTKPDLVLMLRNENYVTRHFIGEADMRAIEVHMGNLRKKLRDNVAAPRFIETVRGVGYRLTAPED